MTKFVVDNGKNLIQAYDAAETDALLNNKANSDDVYSKDAVDAIAATKAANYLIGNSAGNIATFETMFADNLTAIKAEINALQSGSGDPSPDNVRPISGINELNVFVKDGTETIKSTTNIDLGRTVYGGVLDVTSGILTVTWVKIVGLAGRYNSFANGTYSTFYRISLPELSTSGAISIKRGSISNCKIEETAYFGNNRTYEASSANDIFAITTGGELLAIYDKDNTLTQTQFEEKYSDFEACYPLATPQTYQLSQHQIQTILGINNVYHDGNGQIAVEYKDTIQHYIDSRLNALAE